MTITPHSLIGLMLTAVLAAGCVDELPVDTDSRPVPGTFYYTVFENVQGSLDDLRPAIYAVDADGTNRRRITSGVLFSEPNDDYMVFGTPGPRFHSTATVSTLTGGNPTNIAPNIKAYLPTLAPNSSFTAFTEDNFLYVVSGSGLRLIADDAMPGTHIAISPDYTWIAYHGNSNTSTTTIRIVNVQDGTAHTLASNGIIAGDFEGGIGWTSNQRHVIYLGYDAGGNYDIFSIPVTGGAPTNLTNDAGREHGLRVYDNKALYSLGDASSGYDVHVINTDGTGKRNVTNTPGTEKMELYPTWWLFGHKILYTSTTTTLPAPLDKIRVGTLFIQDLEGGRPVEVARNVWIGYWNIHPCKGCAA